MPSNFFSLILQTFNQQYFHIDSKHEYISSNIAGTPLWLDDNGLVCIQWGPEEAVDKYPSVWLKDNCQCKHCFDPSSRQRKLLLKDLDAEIKPTEMSFDHDTKEVRRRIFLQLKYDFSNNASLRYIAHKYIYFQVVISWPDGHQGRFHESWLKERKFVGKPLEKRLIMANRPKPLLWGSPRKGYKKDIRRHKYKQIQEDDQSLFLWLKGSMPLFI